MSNNEKENELVYSLNDIMSERFGRYAKYIIQDRALPDVRDGLKPVQRRILFAMNELRLTFNTSYKKSARIVGEVIGKYHPHGDTSVYDAMVRLSQDWKVRYPLIDMHGNNGSIDGDPAAAMRYTETRLSEISSFLLQDLDKKTVAFAPNFDDSEQEPVVLPALFPNLLVNGSTGIAAGYATNIPPHNLHEIINATIHFIEKPDSTVKDLVKYVKGPDFPTGGIIQGKSGILEAYQTGKGKIIVRSKIEFENNALVITEIPYEVIKQDLVKKIDDIKYNEPGLNIKEVRDETDRKGLRIVIELGKQANVETIRKFLLKNTNLQISYNFNMVAIANKQPRQLGLKEILTHYVEHQQAVVTHRSRFELARAQKRSEIVAGLIKTINILDEVIAVIRHSKDRSDAIHNLGKKFSFTQIQVEAIVQLRLYRLTSTDILQLKAEQKELIAKIAELKAILRDINKLNSVIIHQLELIKKKFVSRRRSVIENEIEAIEIQKTETIIEKDLNIWISRDGYLKALENNQLARLATEEFKRKPGDLWIADFQANTSDKILLITSKGNYVIIPVYKIKTVRLRDIGEHVNTISELPGEEKIISAFLLNDFNKKEQYIMLATKNGMIKKTAVKDFEATRISKALKAINLKNDDEVVASQLVDHHPYVVITTANGFIVKYRKKQIPTLGLRTAGVKSINLRDDVVINAGYCEDDNLVLITNLNTGKKIDLTEIPTSTRPVKGTRLYKLNKDINELVRWTFLTKGKDILHILNQNDEIEIFNTDKMPVHKLVTTNHTLGFENIVDIVIPHYYDLKLIPSKKGLESSSAVAKKHSVHHNEPDNVNNIKPLIEVTKPTNNSVVNKTESNKKSYNQETITSENTNDEESDPNVKLALMIPPEEIYQVEQVIATAEPITTLDYHANSKKTINKNIVGKPRGEKMRQKNKNIKETKKKVRKEQQSKRQLEQTSTNVETSTIVSAHEQEPSPLFVHKTFGKVKTTADMLIEKKQREQAKVALVKAQAQQNNQQKNIKPTVPSFDEEKPSFGKVVTTVETLLKNRQQQINFEFNNSEKDKPIIIKAKSRTEWLKAIEQAPAGTIKVGLRNVSSNNHEQTMQKVDFKQIKNKRVTKANFKKDLAIDETKELQLTIHDILDKSKNKGRIKKIGVLEKNSEIE